MTVRQPLAVIAAGFAFFSYVFLYTPLKRKTTLNTLVGAVAGAMPPVIGWTAVTNSLDPAAAVLFAALFLWQVPHFLSIAWIYRTHYACDGLCILPVLDPNGDRTAQHMVGYCLALFLVSVVPSALGWAGWVYLLGRGRPRHRVRVVCGRFLVPPVGGASAASIEGVAGLFASLAGRTRCRGGVQFMGRTTLKLTSSILAIDLAHRRDQVGAAEKAGADWIQNGQEGASHATRNDRTRPHGRQHGATADQGRAPVRGLRHVAEGSGRTGQGEGRRSLLAARLREERTSRGRSG